MDALTFRVADGEYAIDLLRVQEVSMGVPVTRVPGAPAAVRGVANLRGNVIPIVDLSVRLSGPGVVGGGRAAVLFVKARLGAELAVVGLMVDAVRTVVSIAEGDIVDRSAVAALASAEVVSGLARVGTALVPVLDVDALVSLEGLASLGARSPADSTATAAEPPARGSGEPAVETAGGIPGAGRSAAPPAAGSRAEPREARAPPEVPGEGPGVAAPAPEIAARPSRPATAPVPFVARQSPAAVPRPPAIPPTPGAGAVGLEPAVGARQARRPATEAQTAPTVGAGSVEAPAGRAARPSTGWERAALGVMPRITPEKGRGDRPAMGPVGRITRSGWIVGSVAVLAAAALAALLLGRGGPIPGGRKPGVAIPAGSDLPAARPERPAPVAMVEAPSPRTEASGPPPQKAAARRIEPPEVPAHPRPAPAVTGAPGQVVHEVRRGDTLWHLSGRYLGDPHQWPAIWDVNRDLVRDPDLILPNERLRIPAEPTSRSGAPER